MQLTNHGFLKSRFHYLDARSDLSRARKNISSSTKLNSSGKDTAMISQASKLKSSLLNDKAYHKNLLSTLSYLKVQQEGYVKVSNIYQRMEELSRSSILYSKSPSDSKNKEFNELKKELEKIKNSKFNGISLFDPVSTCGNIKELNVQDSALNYPRRESGVSHTIRGITEDVNAYGGTLSFNVNSGTTGEIYRVFMGNKEIFSTGLSFNGDPTQNIINRTSNLSDPYRDDPANPLLLNSLTNSDTWRTSGTANNGDADKITIDFGPGVKTTYRVELGTSNQAESFNNGASRQENLLSDGGIIRLSDLDENSSSTLLTVHVETGSIGVVSNVEVTPKFFDKEVPVDDSGNKLSLKAVGIETFEEFSIASQTEAKLTSEKLIGSDQIMGELNCIGQNWLPKIAASINRIESELSESGLKNVSKSLALSRIIDPDMAKDTTDHAKSLLRHASSSYVMSNSINHNEILKPLVTNHFKGKSLNKNALL